MFVIYDENTKFPVKVWLSGIDRIEDTCIEQAYHLANLPFLHKWACLMPDTHTGKGMLMGSVSYVVEGRGNEESFHTSSHGAGRAYSRTGAMNAFTTEQVMVDLKEHGVVLGKRKKNDVAEECRFAYKDIDEVMAQQTDLVTPVRKLKTLGVVKG